MVFCVGDDPLGILQQRGLYSIQHKHSQHSTGESTSQFQGLKRGLPLPHDNDDSHTHMHASYTYAQRDIRECFHTHAHRVGLFLLHTLTCPHCPPSVYSWRPRCWYHLILSQLHQPTPCSPLKELFFFFPYSRICILCQSPSTSIWECFTLDIQIQTKSKREDYDWHLCQEVSGISLFKIQTQNNGN